MQSAFYMTEHEHLQAITDIRRIMERSSRFISLSGLSSISAGIVALIGAGVAQQMFDGYYARWTARGRYDVADYIYLRNGLVLLGLAVMAGAFLFGILFTYRKARKNGLPVWDMTARKVFFSGALPMAIGGVFILGLLYNGAEWLVGTSTLIFYGLALINASKYTVPEIRYLGITETVLGLLNLFFLGKGLYFWAIGFGICHIIYGILMWWKYDRKENHQS